MMILLTRSGITTNYRTNNIRRGAERSIGVLQTASVVVHILLLKSTQDSTPPSHNPIGYPRPQRLRNYDISTPVVNVSKIRFQGCICQTDIKWVDPTELCDGRRYRARVWFAGGKNIDSHPSQKDFRTSCVRSTMSRVKFSAAMQAAAAYT